MKLPRYQKLRTVEEHRREFLKALILWRLMGNVPSIGVIKTSTGWETVNSSKLSPAENLRNPWQFITDYIIRIGDTESYLREYGL